MRVLGSFSFPRAPSGRPLKLTSIPPAFPVLSISDLPALICFCLSAVKTRCITDFPSATIETHESSLALICTKNAFSLAGRGVPVDSAGADLAAGIRATAGVAAVAGGAGSLGVLAGSALEAVAGAFAWGSVAEVAGVDWRTLSTPSRTVRLRFHPETVTHQNTYQSRNGKDQRNLRAPRI